MEEPVWVAELSREFRTAASTPTYPNAILPWVWGKILGGGGGAGKGEGERQKTGRG